MPSVRIDGSVVEFMRKRVQDIPALRRKPMSVVLSRSIQYLISKEEQCTNCGIHQAHIAKLELNRQKMARAVIDKGVPLKKEQDVWVTLRPDLHRKAVEYAEAYRRPLKVVAEQALLEYITQPGTCAKCPMKKHPGTWGRR